MHQLFGIFSWYRDTRRWILSTKVALFLSLYVLAMVCIVAVIQTHYRPRPGNWQEGPTRVATIEPVIVALFLSLYVLAMVCIVAVIQTHYRPRPGNWQEGATLGLILLQGLIVAAGSMGYIYVSSKAPRSSQLHLHGFALLTFLMAQCGYFAEPLNRHGHCVAARLFVVANNLLWSVMKVAIFVMVRQKVIALGQKSVCCVQAHRWGSALVVSGAMLGGSSAMLYAFTSALGLAGMTCEELRQASSGSTIASNVHPAVASYGFFFLATATMGAIGLMVAGSATTYVANRLRRQTIRKLVERKVQGEELAKVQKTLSQHVLGMFVSIASTQAVVVAAFVDSLNLLGDGGESHEELMTALVSTFDTLGDVAGILLLSGIGTLLLREDPQAGDISGRIRSVLHSAVLTSQAELAFEGRVDAAVRTGICVASFPGKFIADWHSLTWACEQGEMASACVFLPKADPLKRFGEHVTNPDTPDKCWCHSLYGEEKPWGCLWFTAWKRNVDLAAELELELVAVFFPDQAGKGVVEWAELGNVNLWDGVGLGGSQKAEVAYMKMQGFRLTELDLEAFRQRVHQTSNRRVTVAPALRLVAPFSRARTA